MTKLGKGRKRAPASTVKCLKAFTVYTFISSAECFHVSWDTFVCAKFIQSKIKSFNIIAVLRRKVERLAGPISGSLRPGNTLLL